VDDLSWRGEVVETMPKIASAVQIITSDETGVSAAADPRKDGSAQSR